MATLTLMLLLVYAGAVDSYVRVCYYTNWSQYRNGNGKYFLAQHYQDGLCTHIIFSFGKVEKSGEGYEIVPFEWNDQSRLYKEVISLKVNKNKITVNITQCKRRSYLLFLKF